MTAPEPLREPRTPEQVAAIWESLDALARTIAHDETRAQYLGAV